MTLFPNDGKPLRKHWSVGTLLYRTEADRAACRRLKMTAEEREASRPYQKARREFATRDECEAYRATLPPEVQAITASYEGARL